MKSNLKVFIVEDDPFFGALVKERLLNEGYNSLQLISTSTQFLDRLLEMPDVVILDFNLDKLNGIDLLRKIKSVSPNIQVIFLSAQAEMSVAVNSLKYGAYDYIEKNESSLNKLLIILDRIQETNHYIKRNLALNKFKKMTIAIGAVAIIVALIFTLV
jgi:DNA-binding NtrC family response regulator